MMTILHLPSPLIAHRQPCLLLKHASAVAQIPLLKVANRNKVVIACSTVARPANFQGNIMIYNNSEKSMEHWYKVRTEELNESVKHMLEDDLMGLVDKLDLIDAIQRLGVGYRFEKEIKRIMNVVLKDNDYWLQADLYTTALRFRLLRQHGYRIPLDVFDRFKDELGKFTSFSLEDVKGILSLYEASYLSVQGENSLDEAKLYATKWLESFLGNTISSTLAKKVAHSLELPLRWRLPMVEARWYIDIYEHEENVNALLLEFSKLDFNIVQAAYQREMSSLARWWLDSGLQSLGFYQDRLVESFFGSLAMVSEPKLWLSRERMTKIMALKTVIEDVYSVYGSLEELELFTNAIERWDISAANKLPHYMKKRYLALLNTTNQVAYEILQIQGYDITQHQKEVWIDLCKTYLVEAKWFYGGYTPKLEEYFNNAVTTLGASLSLITCYFLTATKITTEVTEYIEGLPPAIHSAAMIFQLENDMGTSNDELKGGDVPKAMQCYMHQTGCSEEVARRHITGLLDETWKKMNKAKFAQEPFSNNFSTAVLNHARSAKRIYRNGGEHGDRKVFSDSIESLLVQPISMK